MSKPDRFEEDAPPRRRLFLERRGYMQKRVIDGARLLPVVGLVLFMIPLIWPKGTGGDVITGSKSALYIFATWFALIVVGGFLAYRINTISEPQDTGGAADNPDFADEGSALDGSE